MPGDKKRPLQRKKREFRPPYPIIMGPVRGVFIAGFLPLFGGFRNSDTTFGPQGWQGEERLEDISLCDLLTPGKQGQQIPFHFRTSSFCTSICVAVCRTQK